METAIKEAKEDETKEVLQAEYDKTAHLLQRQNKSYRGFCSDNKLKTFDERLQVARWSRQQAIAATKSVDKRRKEDYNRLEPQVRAEMATYSKKMNVGAQNKHIINSSNYDATRSTLTADPQELYNLYAGKSLLKLTDSGEWTHKEFFVHSSPIGIHRDLKGNEEETAVGCIRYSKTKGWHITPASSEGYKK